MYTSLLKMWTYNYYYLLFSSETYHIAIILKILPLLFNVMFLQPGSIFTMSTVFTEYIQDKKILSFFLIDCRPRIIILTARQTNIPDDNQVPISLHPQSTLTPPTFSAFYYVPRISIRHNFLLHLLRGIFNAGRAFVLSLRRKAWPRFFHFDFEFNARASSPPERGVSWERGREDVKENVVWNRKNEFGVFYTFHGQALSHSKQRVVNDLFFAFSPLA